jgi:hypothetical protein
MPPIAMPTPRSATEPRTFKPWRPVLQALCAATLIGTLAACGGGGGGPDPTPATTLKASDLQGRWSHTSSTPTQTAYIIPTAGSSGTEGWMLTSDLSVLEYWSLNTSGSNSVSANVQRYSLGADTDPTTASYSGTASVEGTPSLILNAQTYSRTSNLNTAVVLASVSGTWTASAGGSTVTQTLSVNASGDISGSSTTGCSYSGQLSSRVGVGVLGLSLTETCGTAPTQTVKSFAGMATYAPAVGATLARLTLVGITTTGPKRALVIAAQGADSI